MSRYGENGEWKCHTLITLPLRERFAQIRHWIIENAESGKTKCPDTIHLYLVTDKRGGWLTLPYSLDQAGLDRISEALNTIV